jgi:glycosyltransferase involved in cell wall biosynthesis
VANELLTDTTDATMTWVCRPVDHAMAAAMLLPAARERTRFLAWTVQDELQQIYDAHGILLFPSLFEGFGKAYIEASARGLCVVATPTGAMRDLIVDGHNGFLSGFNDAEDMAAKIRTLWGELPTAVRISAAARCTADRHSWDRVGRETAQFYERLRALHRPTEKL